MFSIYNNDLQHSLLFSYPNVVLILDSKSSKIFKLIESFVLLLIILLIVVFIN